MENWIQKMPKLGFDMFYRNMTANSGKASACISCGQWEGVCPQHLPVIELIREASEKFDS